MARMTSMEALEAKIEKVQAQVSKTKKQYDAAVAALLHLLAGGLLETVDPGCDAELLSESIRRECSINKRMADRLAIILYTLYSQDNRKKWRRKEKEGLKQFLNEDFLCDWKGFAVWDAGNGTGRLPL